MQTTVGVFEEDTTATSAVDELLSQGFSAENISIEARDAEVPAAAGSGTAGTVTGIAIGSVLGGATGLLVSLTELAMPGLSTPLAATAAGVGLGAVAGGLLGVLTDLGMPERQVAAYRDWVRDGRVLVVVRTRDALAAHRAAEILRHYHPLDLDTAAP